jgi:hypothetical protein
MKSILLTLSIAACGPPLPGTAYPGRECLLIDEAVEDRTLQCRDGNYVWTVGRFYGAGPSKVWVEGHWEKL